jgi:hypothetical protein
VNFINFIWHFYNHVLLCRLAEEGADEEACERLVVASFHLFRELQQHLPTDGDQSHQPLWVTMLHRREASHLSCFTNVVRFRSSRLIDHLRLDWDDNRLSSHTA